MTKLYEKPKPGELWMFWPFINGENNRIMIFVRMSVDKTKKFENRYNFYDIENGKFFNTGTIMNFTKIGPSP